MSRFWDGDRRLRGGLAGEELGLRWFVHGLPIGWIMKGVSQVCRDLLRVNEPREFLDTSLGNGMRDAGRNSEDCFF